MSVAAPRTGAVWSVVGILLVVILVAGGWAFGYRANVKTAAVPIPASSATPDRVVLAYAEAYNHRDFGTVAALYPSRAFAPGLDRHRAIGTMRDLRIISSHQDVSYGVDSPYWAVTVRLEITGGEAGDLGYPDGPNGWTYYLERSGGDRAWRIADSGNA